MPQQAFGDEQWQRETAQRLGLEFTLRPRGRPRKKRGAISCDCDRPRREIGEMGLFLFLPGPT